jgi:hypothetical protein
LRFEKSASRHQEVGTFPLYLSNLQTERRAARELWRLDRFSTRDNFRPCGAESASRAEIASQAKAGTDSLYRYARFDQ